MSLLSKARAGTLGLECWADLDIDESGKTYPLVKFRLSGADFELEAHRAKELGQQICVFAQVAIDDSSWLEAMNDHGLDVSTIKALITRTQLLRRTRSGS
jgi:hypothetical protein